MLLYHTGVTWYVPRAGGCSFSKLDICFTYSRLFSVPTLTVGSAVIHPGLHLSGSMSLVTTVGGPFSKVQQGRSLEVMVMVSCFLLNTLLK